MSNNVKFGLQVEIDGDRVVVSGIQNVENAFGKMRGEVKKTEQDLKSATETNRTASDSLFTLNKMAKAVGGALAAIGVGKFVADLYQVNASTQQFKASLEVATGSIDGANQAWSTLEQFAASTPYALTQSVQAFITMSNLGLVPTEEKLRSFGNTASAMGKDLMQMIEAVADASTGEFERLKEFGIKAKSEGDTIRFIFRGIETEVANSAGAIVEYLEGIGNTSFAGQMERQMDTLGGAMSNLEDNVDGLMRAIGEAGGSAGLAGTIKSTSEVVQRLTIEVNAMSEAALQSGEAANAAGSDFDWLHEIIGVLYNTVVITKAEFLDLGDVIGYWAARTELVAKREVAARTFQFNKVKELNRQIVALDIARAENREDVENRIIESIGARESASAKMRDALDLENRVSAEAKAAIDELLKSTDLFALSSEQAGQTVERATVKLDELKISGEDLKDRSGKWLTEADRQAKEYERTLQSLIDRLDPLGAEARKLQADMALLNRALASGDITPERHRELAAALADIGFTVRENTLPSLEELEDQANPMADAWEQAMERVDAAFADAWEGAFDSFEDFTDAIEDAFKRLLAEMAHLAITKPILIQLGFGGEGTGGILDQMNGGNFNLSSLFNNLAGSTPFAGIGMGIQDFALNNPAFGGLFDVGTNVATLSTMDIGLAALAGYAGDYLGGEIGKAIFGKEAESSLGAQIGGIGGTLIGGPVGALIGSTIGAMLDVAFGGDGKERVSLGVLTEPGTANNPNHADRYRAYGASGLEYTAFSVRAGEEGEDLARTLTDVVAYTDSVITGLYSAMGTDIQGLLAGQTLDGKSAGAGADWAETFFGSAEFNEINQEDIQNLPDAIIGALQAKIEDLTGIVVDLKPFEPLINDGESLVDTIVRVQGEFLGANAVMDALGQSTFEFSTQGMAAASMLVEQAGGLDALVSAADYYYQNVYSEQERAQILYDQHSQAIVDFNAQFGTAITTTDDLREYVDSLANSETFASEATQAAWVAALNLTPALVNQAAASEILTAAAQEAEQAALAAARAAEEEAAAKQRAAEEAWQRQLVTVGDVAETIFGNYANRQEELADLQDQLADINGEIANLTDASADVFEPIPTAIDAITDSVDSLTQSSSQLRSQANSIFSTIAQLSLGQSSYLTNKEQLDFARQQYASAHEQYRSTGDASALSGAAQSLAQELATYYAGSATGRAEFDSIIDYLGTVGVSLDTQADAAERAEAIAQAQRTALESLDTTQTSAFEAAQENARLDQLYQEKQLIEQQIANLTAQDSQAILDQQLDHLIDVTDGIDSLNELLGYLPNDIADALGEALGLAVAEYRDLTDLEAFFTGLQDAGIPSFDVGTPFVSHDQVANIHRGEIIIDPQTSDALRRYGINVQGGSNADVVARLDAIVARLESLENTTGTGFSRSEIQRGQHIDATREQPSEIARQLLPIDTVGAR